MNYDLKHLRGGPLHIGERVTVMTDPALDSVQLCLSSHVVIAEILDEQPPRYRIRYDDGWPGSFGAPMLRERLVRGWL